MRALVPQNISQVSELLLWKNVLIRINLRYLNNQMPPGPALVLNCFGVWEFRVLLLLAGGFLWSEDTLFDPVSCLFILNGNLLNKMSIWHESVDWLCTFMWRSKCHCLINHQCSGKRMRQKRKNEGKKKTKEGCVPDSLPQAPDS